MILVVLPKRRCNLNRKIIYKFSPKPASRLSWQDRILMFMVQHDLAAGRDGAVSDWYGDLKEAIFMFSSGFVYYSAEIYANCVYWDELREYGQPDQFREEGIKLPPGHVGLASPIEGDRRAFYLTLRRLIREKTIWGFTSTFRAIRGLGGKSIPLLQVWDEANRDAPKDIFAVSLTETGFKKSQDLNAKHKQMAPWNIHKAITESKKFAAELTKKS